MSATRYKFISVVQSSHIRSTNYIAYIIGRPNMATLNNRFILAVYCKLFNR